MGARSATSSSAVVAICELQFWYFPNVTGGRSATHSDADGSVSPRAHGFKRADLRSQGSGRCQAWMSVMDPVEAACARDRSMMFVCCGCCCLDTSVAYRAPHSNLAFPFCRDLGGWHQCRVFGGSRSAACSVLVRFFGGGGSAGGIAGTGSALGVLVLGLYRC